MVAEFIILARARTVVSVSRGRHSSSFADVARVAANPRGDGRIRGEHGRMETVAARAAFPPPPPAGHVRTEAAEWPECERFRSGERRTTIKVWAVG